MKKLCIFTLLFLFTSAVTMAQSLVGSWYENVDELRQEFGGTVTGVLTFNPSKTFSKVYIIPAPVVCGNLSMIIKYEFTITGTYKIEDNGTVTTKTKDSKITDYKFEVPGLSAEEEIEYRKMIKPLTTKERLKSTQDWIMGDKAQMTGTYSYSITGDTLLFDSRHYTKIVK